MKEHKAKLLALLAATGLVQAGGVSEITVSRGSSSEKVTAPAANFTGTVRLQSQFRRESPSRLAGATVFFEPAARTKWHTHPVGQTLVVLSGTGFVQRWGGKRETIREGDVVWIPPNVKHWHGAIATSSMSHVAIVETVDGKSVDWLEAVSDQQYGEQ